MKKFNEIMITLILFVASFTPLAIIANKNAYIENISSFDYIIKKEDCTIYVELKPLKDKYNFNITLLRLNETLSIDTYITDDTPIIELSKVLNTKEVKQLDQINWFNDNYVTIRLNGKDIKSIILSIDSENTDIIEYINNSIKQTISNKALKINKNFRKNTLIDIIQHDNEDTKQDDSEDKDTSDNNIKDNSSFNDLLNLINDIF